MKTLNLLLLLFCSSFLYAGNLDFHYDKIFVEQSFDKLDLLESAHKSNPEIKLENLLSVIGLEGIDIQAVALNEYASRETDSIYIVYGILIGFFSCILILGIWFILETRKGCI